MTCTRRGRRSPSRVVAWRLGRVLPEAPISDHPEPKVSLFLIHQEELGRRRDTPRQFPELAYDRVNVSVIECATPKPTLRELWASPGGRILADKIAKTANAFAPKVIAAWCLGS
jgi:hypothetical protein